MIGIATGVATLCAGTGAALAGGGGIASPAAPELTDFQCVEKCAGVKAATVGSRIQFAGKNLTYLSEARFMGAGGNRLAATPATATETLVEARVPAGAETGTVLLSGGGARATTAEELEIVAESAIPDAGEFRLASAQATPHKTFFDGPKPPTVNYLFEGGAPTDVRIEVVDRTTKEPVASFIDPAAEPNAQNVAEWDGLTSAGLAAPNGEYRFRIGNAAGGTATTTDESRFGYYRFRFPIAAKHTYGDGYGAGRNHQGQDVFSRCGTALRAARGGRVQWNKTHASAGNYLVIDLKGSKVDHMYAHMLSRSPLAEGARVRTGQVIGQVGESGNASGCHLHFEAWSAPGWYEGGSALPSVANMLKAWDRWS
jgi:murein DD-endopeptidase MepM/ murein hydrolase activator NlpD